MLGAGKTNAYTTFVLTVIQQAYRLYILFHAIYVKLFS